MKNRRLDGGFSRLCRIAAKPVDKIPGLWYSKGRQGAL